MIRVINENEEAAARRHTHHIATQTPLPRTPPPSAPLTPAFARGWLKLPVELKTLILRHNLVSPAGIEAYHEYAYVDDTLQATRHVTLAAVLRKHLAMGEDIAQFAKEVYYKHNVFIFKTTSGGMRYRICMPPYPLRSLIRRLEIRLYATYRNWPVLSSLAGGWKGFSGLRHVTVHVRWHDKPYPEYFVLLPEGRGARERVVFGCAGQVVFEEVQGEKRAWVERYLAEKGTDMEHIEEWVKGLVRFAGEGWEGE